MIVIWVIVALTITVIVGEIIGAWAWGYFRDR